MVEKIVALDIGSSHLRAIEAVMKNGVPQITRIMEVPLESHIVQNGVILSSESLGIALGKLWRDGKFESKDVLTFASGSSIVNRVVDDLAWAAPEDFKKMLPYSLRDRLPFDTDDYYLDEHTLTEYRKANSPELYKAVLVTGVEKTYVDSMIAALEGNGLKPRGIDALPLTLIRSHDFSEPYEAEEIVASIELGANVTTIVLHQDHQPVYLHTAPGIGGQKITERLAQELGITFPEAEFLKISLTMTPEQREKAVVTIVKDGGAAAKVNFASFSQEQVNEALSIISQEVSNLISHINDIFEDSSEDPDAKISTISLSGGGAMLYTLAQRLSSELAIPVKLSAPFGEERSRKIAKRVFDNQQRFSAVFGLLLGQHV
jgi:type IV pilus assembly protein PilM